MIDNQRSSKRFCLSLPVQISFGSQITLQGQIKDLSLKSAFIIIKSSVHMAMNEELTFVIEDLPHDPEGRVEGSARISRVAVGEGIAIYFTRVDDASIRHLQCLTGASV